MASNKKVYFISDLHLGIDGTHTSADRESRVTDWLRSIADDIGHLYLVGDIFDFWFEYKTVIPKGYSRWFGTMAWLRDQGISITQFTGNHDLWQFGYVTDELGINLCHEPQVIEHHGKRVLIGHGDGLGPDDRGYKWLKKLFTNRLAQNLFYLLHPDLAVWLMRRLSKLSRGGESRLPTYLGPEREWLIRYAERKMLEGDYDHFVFGHRHLPIQHRLSDGRATYVNLGDWLHLETYAVLDGEGLRLVYFDNPDGKIYGDR